MLKKIDFLKAWKLRKRTRSGNDAGKLFRFKYAAFRMLLDSNSQLLQVISDVEEKLRGQQVFGMSYVRAEAGWALFHTMRMVKSLDDLSHHRYPRLFEAVQRIERKIKEEMSGKKESIPAELTLTYDRINREMIDWVGGKNANLGEMRGRLHLPIPEGFCITSRGFTTFLSHHDLSEKINTRKMEIDPSRPGTIAKSSQEIQKLINSAEVPEELEAAINGAYDKMVGRADVGKDEKGDLRVSMRSSATREDSTLSFAGQYLSVLNVTRDRLIATYKQVVASLYTPPAIAYRLNKGIRDEDIAMSVACLEMIDSVASGIIYTRHPFDFMENNIFITAVWGLGSYAVEGPVTPDSYVVDKKERGKIKRTVVSHKPVQLVSLPQGGLQEVEVEPQKQDAPCLSPEQVGTLAEYALTLERHYRHPQDIEWALDGDGRLVLLQSRPLQIGSSEYDTRYTRPVSAPSHYPVLLEEGEVACPGVGCGPAFCVNFEEDLIVFPEGAILVARRSSPKFVLAMGKARAIITDVGSVAGHMASLAREFSVPTILNTRTATAVITTGMEITVDAYLGVVYRGTVPELLPLQKTIQSPMKDTPVYKVLRRIADLIVPLSLTDPGAPNFVPECCATLHDVGRFVHESSYVEMFQIGDLASQNEGFAVKLDAHIPLDLYVIDLGGGISEQRAGSRKIKIEDISSAPFSAVLKGMTHEDFRRPQVRPISLDGFFSVMREQMTAPPPTAERFGERSFAIVSDNYVNFSSRVGYHYSVLDSYCGPNVDMNYINFSFKGGAADFIRRNRRVRAISLILEKLDFVVSVQADTATGRIHKYGCDLLLEKLDFVGRLLLFTRQMDMLMKDEESVTVVARDFLSGNYSLDYPIRR